MEKDPKKVLERTVSIIIPVYNAVDFVERAVRSAIEQEGVKEIIIVDDGSKDNSLSLCLKLKELSQKIQVYTHPDKNNKGLAATRNRALEFATGDWIQLLDADDELLPGKIQSQLSIADYETAFVVGNSIDRFSGGRTYPRKYFTSPWIGLISGKLGISTANLFNRKYVELVGRFDSSLRTSEEYDLMFRIMKQEYMPKFDPAFLTYIHKTEGSLSRGKEHQEVLIKNWVNLRKQIKEYLESNGKFRLIEAYFYAGAVGSFLENFSLPLDSSISKPLFRLFKLEKRVKRLGHRFVKMIK